MQIVIDLTKYQYNNIMALKSACLGRVPYKGIIMYAINAIKRGKALEQEPCDKCIYSTSKGECQYDDIAETIPTEQEPKITNYYTNEKGQRIQIDYDIYDTARISRDLLEIYLEEHGFRKCGE